MDKNVNIKFNATDGGSFEKFASKYKDLLKGMSGGNYNTNKSYVFSEMEKELDFYNKKIQKERELFDLKKRQMTELGNISNKAFNDYNSKHIGRQQYENIEADVKRREQELLKGTGRRSFSTYSKAAQSHIDALQGGVNTKSAFMDETNTLLRQILNLDRETASERLREMRRNGTPAEKLAAEMADQQIKYEKGREDQPQSRSLLNTLVIFDALTKGLDGLKGIATAKNGFDAFDKLGETASATATGVTEFAGKFLSGLATKYGGSGAGKMVDAITPFLAKAAGTATAIDFDIKSNTVRSREQMYEAQNRFRATTGRDGKMYDMSDYGYTFSDFANRQTDVARSAGSSRNAEGNAVSSMLLERGYGVDSSTTNQLLDLMRSMSSTDRSLTNLVGGVWEKGQSIFRGDRTYLNEFMQKNFSGLEKELLRNQTHVSSGTTLSLLSQFNSLGGQFDAQHQNSSGLISQINNALINPTSDNTNALSFAALRQMNPGAGIFDILKTRQKGLGAKGYLPAMLKMVDHIGGSEDMRKMNLAGMLGMTDNLDAVDTLYRNRGKIINGKISSAELRSSIDKNLPDEAQKNTAFMQKADASMFNKMVEGGFASMKEAANQLVTVVGLAFENKTFTVYGQNGQVLRMTKTVQENVVPKPTVTKSGRQTLDISEPKTHWVRGTGFIKE